MTLKRLYQIRTHTPAEKRAGVFLNINPEIILRATNTNKPVGAFRVWFLAKNFDKGGSGFIPAKEFRHYLLDLGVTRPTLYRWIDQAKSLKLITQTGDVYRLTAWQYGAQVAGVTQMLPHVWIDPRVFVAKGWLAEVWKVFLTHFKTKVVRKNKDKKDVVILLDRAISQRRLQQITGVKPRTQRHYNKVAGIEKTQNYADLGSPTADPDRAMTYPDRPGHYPKNGRWRRRMPNTHHPGDRTPTSRGRIKQVNQFLRSCNNVDSIQKKHKLYCLTDKELTQAQKRTRTADAKTRPDTLFLRIKTVKPGVTVWCGVSA